MGAELIGINNRDLTTFEVSLDTTTDLIDSIPDNVLVVSESGINSSEEISRLFAKGVKAVLIGEALMKDEHPAVKVKELLG
jgi:indole-3-glycerol phosphate synthase